METDENNCKKNNLQLEKIDKKIVDIFLKLVLRLDMNTVKELNKEGRTLLTNKMQYINNLISLYLNEKNKYFSKISKYKRTEYIIKSYKNYNSNKIYKIFNEKEKKIINNFFIILFFCSFNKVISYKENNNKNNIILLYKLLNKVNIILAKLYNEEIIEINTLDLILNLFLNFAIKNNLSSLEKDSESNNEIMHSIFLQLSIDLIKLVFDKIDNFTEKHIQLLENYIVFIINNILYSNHSKHHIIYINKFFLSKNDFKTFKFLDLENVILKANNEKLKNKYFELISTIYSFNFEYENIMRPLILKLEPLFINLQRKDLDEINSELNKINFSLDLINFLIDKEKKILKDVPCLLNEGFYLRNNNSGIITYINSLESEFTLVFGFNIDKDNEDEIILFKMVNNEKNSFLKLFLREKYGSDKYELLMEDSKNTKELKVIIEKNIFYIFAINFKSEGVFAKDNIIRARYIKDTSGKDEFNCGYEIKLKNFKNENIKIYFGCDVHLKKDKIQNKFKGIIGDIIIFNSKNYKYLNTSSKNFFEGDFIIPLKGNYKKFVNLLIECQENNIIINKKEILELKEKMKGREIDKLDKFNLENIKLVISSEYFKLINYYDDIDYIKDDFLKINKSSDMNREEYFIKKKYIDLKLKNENNDNDLATKIDTSYFDKGFHIFKNELTIERFVKYDGINFLSLLMEYYFQILNNIYERKMKKETQEIKIISKRIENIIFDNLKFFNENILKNISNLNINTNDIHKYFYQMSITILKFIEIEEINPDIINYLLNIIENIKDNNNENFINEIKIKLIEFLLNPNFYRNEEIDLKKLNSALKSILNILTENLKNSNFKKNLINEGFFNQLFLFLFLCDNYNNTTKEKENKENIIINNIEDELLNETRKIYTSILTMSLKIIIIKKEEVKEFQLVEESEPKNKSSKNVLNNENNKQDEEERTKQNKMIELVFEKLFENKDNTNIFCALMDIIQKLDLIQNADVGKIVNTLMSIVKVKNKEERNTKNKILNSCIIYLVKIYLEGNDNEKIKEKNFHVFIRKLGINSDVIYSLISSINILKIDPNEKEKDIDYEQTLVTLNIKSLNENHYKIVHIIKSIFEDIVYILNSNLSSGEQNSVKEVFSVLEKNIDLIFNSVKETQNLCFKEFFSSDSKICAEFFYIQWKTVKNKVFFIENLIKKYNILFKIFPNPFIFKFYYIFFKESSDLGNNENNINKIKLTLLSGIIKSLNDYIHKSKENNNISLINNLFNLVIILFLEYEKNSSLLKNNNFIELFYNCISILDLSGALYSNYYIELNGINGKIISEIIYDIYFAISDYSFDKGKFVNFFIKFNEKNKESFTIFYFIDICKEKFLEKDKKTKDDIKGFIAHYEKIIFIRNYLKSNNNKIKLFLGKNLYKIEHVNLSIYFLAKSFIYYKKKLLNEDFKKILMDSFLPLLSDDIYNLYTQRSRFYGNELCKNFPLYYYAKAFIETNIIPDKDFKKYISYINNEMPMELKDEYNLESCYSSRLSKNKKFLKKKISMDGVEINENKDNNILNSEESKRESIFSINITNSKLNRIFNSTKIVNTYINSPELDLSFKSLNESSKLSSERDDDSSVVTNLNTESINLNTFSDLNKNARIIFNGKKYFFLNIFSEIFKNMMFDDKYFKKIKLKFLIKYKKYKNINKDTKQFNYPVEQKQFCNSIEPNIFLKRDFNFYNNYLFITHKYLENEKDIILQNADSINFYPHIFKFENKIDKNNFLFCELVTLKYITFGKMYFCDNYIIFNSEQEDPRDFKKHIDLDTFIKYGISTKNKFIASKKKFIIIYAKFISEIIQRRTLLINNSIEIFEKNGKSYFFNFFRTKHAKTAYDYIKNLNENLLLKNIKNFDFSTNFNKGNIKALINSFKKGKISNLEYILKLNKYSTRTYKDTSQYPVFPWIVKNFDKMQELIQKLWNKENINSKELLSYFRDMNYPIAEQKEENREESKKNYLKDEEEVDKNDESEKFPCHWINHYSTSAYVYYYLTRLNPYLYNVINLQGEGLDDKDRVFSNFKDIEEILYMQADNRELIPDFFCYFDFMLNLNCAFFGNYDEENLTDDFILTNNKNTSKYANRISSYVIALINNYKILNSFFVSKIINNWVDIIFGVKQLPENKKERFESCNIYKKQCYEQMVNIEDEIKPFEDKILLNQKNEKEESEFMNEIIPLKDNIINFGICPRQILDENVVYDGKIKSYDTIFKSFKFPDDKLIYFDNITDENFILMKDIKKNKTKSRVIVFWDNKNIKDKEGIQYNIRSMNLFKEKNGLKNIQLYQYKYSFCTLTLMLKSKIEILLSCRYHENYFRVQCQDKILNIFYEDFITTIKERNLEEYDNVFYTGLINGKLTEWVIIPSIESNNKNKKKVIKCIYDFTLREKKHIYAHKAPITVIEIYRKQNIIITAGEDKFIFIRKLFDFELLTSIDLIYTFGNPIISLYQNIFPSMIKISDLNLLYVLIYDFTTQKNFIRGYNLNGIFFSQTDQMFFKDNKINLQFNNFSFTKYSSLVVGFYNSNKFFVLNPGILTPVWVKELEEKEEGKKEKKEKSKEKVEIGNKVTKFNLNNGEFYILKDHEVIFTSINDKQKLKEFETF